MFDESTFNNRHGAEAGVDPVPAMFAERNRLFDLAGDKEDAAHQILKTLPKEIREGKVMIMEGDLHYGGSWSSEDGLLRYLAAHRSLYVTANKLRDYKPPERDTPEVEQGLIDEFDRAYTDEALRQFREGKAKLNAVREASGCEALFREARVLSDQAAEIDYRIDRTVATSFAGLLAQLEVLRENFGECALIETIIAGVKRLPCFERPGEAVSADADSRILSLFFREWAAARRHASTLYDGLGVHGLPDEEAEKQAWAHVDELHRVIFDTPAAGVVGIAIKAYLQIHDWDSGRREDGAGLSRDSQDWQGLLKDAARFVPELAPLVVNALKEPDADDAEAESAAMPERLAAGVGFGEP